MNRFFCLFKLKLITIVEYFWPQDTLLEKPYTFYQAKVAFYLNINPKLLLVSAPTSWKTEWSNSWILLGLQGCQFDGTFQISQSWRYKRKYLKWKLINNTKYVSLKICSKNDFFVCVCVCVCGGGGVIIRIKLTPSERSPNHIIQPHDFPLQTKHLFSLLIFHSNVSNWWLTTWRSSLSTASSSRLSTESELDPEAQNSQFQRLKMVCIFDRKFRIFPK